MKTNNNTLEPYLKHLMEDESHMNTHETYVSLEVAKLLKQAGFDWSTRYSYDLFLYSTEGEKRVIDGFASTFCNEHNGLASMPTLEVAQRWLREVKDVDIMVRIDYHYGENYSNAYKAYCSTFYIGDKLITNGHFKIFEEALETGIKKALEIILEKGE